MNAPVLSVIIPSYNRCESLEMVLQGLTRQTVSPDRFEVIVVLDGSTDGSASMLYKWQKDQRLTGLRWLIQENAGQAAARTTGANHAQSSLLLFLDDDVVPEPDLIAVHLSHHAAEAALVVLGDAEVVREKQDSLYHLGVWAWWEDTYHNRALPGRQPGCRDFCSGNVSLRKEDFLKAGGFDPAFRGYGGEDYELGYRLLKSGVNFISDRRARARHYHRTTVKGVLRATRQEAHGDALMGQKHPELRRGLRLTELPKGSYRLLALLALLLPTLGDLGVEAGLRLLPVFERLQLRTRWLRLFDHLRGYSYWRGVREVFGSLKALRTYQASAVALPLQSLEVAGSLPADLPPLWVDGPSLLEITWRGRRLGVVELESFIDQPLPGYLANELAHKLKGNLWLALSQEGTPLWSQGQKSLRESASGKNDPPPFIPGTP